MKEFVDVMKSFTKQNTYSVIPDKLYDQLSSQ